jgi:hypothetical protein
MAIVQTRIVNANYYVIEKFEESFIEEPVTFLRSIRVMKASAPAFYQRLAEAVRVMFGLPTPSVQNVTARFDTLLRNGVLRSFQTTPVNDPNLGPGSLLPPAIGVGAPATAAFIHFENAADPTYVDIFFWTNPDTEGVVAKYNAGIYLGHSIIGGPVGGIAQDEVQPAVPVEPPPGD